MEPNKKINIEEVMRHLREAMSAHISRNANKHFPQQINQEIEEDKSSEEIPVEALPQDSVRLSWITRPRTNLNGWPTNISIGRNGVEQHVEIRENGGKVY